jgi:hypothetical protein
MFLRNAILYTGSLFLLSATASLTAKAGRVPNLEGTSQLPVCPLTSSRIATPSNCVVAGSIFLRENSLPICDWGSDLDRSYMQLIRTTDGHRGPWQCVNLTVGTVCKIQNGKPDQVAYWLLGPSTMAWTNGAALYGVREFACRRTTSSVDDLLEQSVVGQLDVPDDCGGVPAHPVALTDVDGGVVEHVRPAMVRGEALLRVGNDSPPGRSVTLAIQIFNNGTWVDHQTMQVASTGTLTRYEVQDQVSPGEDVRLQVRGATCEGGFVHDYVIADARIQVETCIPDQGNPGTCL